MSEITDLNIGKRQGKRVNVFLDGKFAFSLQAEVAVKEGLQVGQELSAEQVKAITGSDQFQRCFNVAIRCLGYRPRSESEVRGQLQRRRFDVSSIETVLAKLKEQGLVDDVAFAQFWKDNRESFSPRSQWLMRLELRRKGVSGEIIDNVVNAVDDGDSAYRAALSRARRWSLSDYEVFRRRLGEYLRRRGFGYEVVRYTVERVWQEFESSSRDSILT